MIRACRTGGNVPTWYRRRTRQRPWLCGSPGSVPTVSEMPVTAFTLLMASEPGAFALSGVGRPLS